MELGKIMSLKAAGHDTGDSAGKETRETGLILVQKNVVSVDSSSVTYCRKIPG